MNLHQKTVAYIEQDILQVLHFLRTDRVIYNLRDAEALRDRIYWFYNSHAGSLVKEEIEVFRTKLLQVHSSLQRIPGLHFVEKPNWFRYYTLDPTNKAALNSCVFRIYLNPKVEHLDVIVDLAAYYFALPPPVRKPLHFKYVNPNHAAARHLQRADRIVLYASKEGDLVPSLLDRLRSYPDSYFYNASPLFTHKFRPGVSWAFSPREDSAFVSVLRDLTKDKELQLSYGTYMGYLIAAGLKVVLVNSGISKSDKNFIDFSTLAESQWRKIYPELCRFVINRANRDLHI